MTEFADAYDELTDLISEANAGQIRTPWLREQPIEKAVAALIQGQSVLICCPEGCGKTSVINGIAARFANKRQKGLRRTFTSQILAGTKYIGEWQTKLNAIADGAGHSS